MTKTRRKTHSYGHSSFGVLVIPVEASLGAALNVFIEISLDGAVLQERVDVNIIFVGAQRHADITEVIHHSFPRISPFAGRCGAPGAVVAGHPLSELIIFSCSSFFRTPVYLRDEDRLGSDHRHLILEVADEGIVIIALVACPIPSRIDMDSIAKVAVGDGMRGIVLILALIAGTRDPYHALKSVLSDDIDNRLEIVVQGR